MGSVTLTMSKASLLSLFGTQCRSRSREDEGGVETHERSTLLNSAIFILLRYPVTSL